MLTLSETWSDTLDVTEEASVVCDVTLSEGVLAELPEESQALYEIIRTVLPRLWHHLAPLLSENPWVEGWAAKKHGLTWSLILVNNAEMHDLNHQYRNKDSATDVLTFSLLEDPLAAAQAAHLPEVSLGEVYLSVTWASEQVCNDKGPELNFSAPLTLFILERLIHGCLHLLGVHHDTLSDYNKVVGLQRTVLDALSHEDPSHDLGNR